MNTTVRITLDIHKIGSQAVIPVFQGDSGYTIVAHLTESGKPFPLDNVDKAYFQSIKPNGDCLDNECRIENNAIVYDFKQKGEETCQTTSVLGTSKCQFKLIGTNGAILASPFFDIVVSENVYSEKQIIESAPEYTALTEYVATLEQRVKNGDFKGEKGDKGDPGEITYTELEQFMKPYATREDVGTMLEPYATSDDIGAMLEPYATSEELEEKTSAFIPCIKVDALPEVSEDTKNKVYLCNGCYSVARSGSKGYEVGQTFSASDKVKTGLTKEELHNILDGLYGYDASWELFTVSHDGGESWTFFWASNDEYSSGSNSFCASMWSPNVYDGFGGISALVDAGFAFGELNSRTGGYPYASQFTITNISELGQQIFGGTKPKWVNLLTGEEVG